MRATYTAPISKRLEEDITRAFREAVPEQYRSQRIKPSATVYLLQTEIVLKATEPSCIYSVVHFAPGPQCKRGPKQC